MVITSSNKYVSIIIIFTFTWDTVHPVIHHMAIYSKTICRLLQSVFLFSSLTQYLTVKIHLEKKGNIINKGNSITYVFKQLVPVQFIIW